MSRLTRRQFLGSVAGTLPVLALPGRAGGLPLPVEEALAQPLPPPLAPPLPSSPLRPALPAELLRALARVVLPSELGEAEMERACAGFEAWLAGYRPGAEALHGYGTSELTYLSADPAPGWSAELEALELEARERHGRGFAELDLSARRDLVERRLEGGTGALPPAAEARHVAVGFVAWWAATPEATDLCYRARIGRETCRPLGEVKAPPAPLLDGA